MANTATILCATIASLGLLAAPATATTVPTVTYDESVGCLKNGIIFFTAANTSPSFGDTGEIEKHTMFWAEQADGLGTPSAAETDQSYDEALAMAMTIFEMETEAEVAAFIAPHQAEFDACTAKRAAIQAG